MSRVIERFFETREAMYQSLLANTAYQLEKAIEQRGRASALISGGSTPQPLYQALSRIQLPWQAVTLAMVDERWVSTEHPASNEGQIRLNLLKDAAARAQLIAMKTQHHDAAAAQITLNQRYAVLDWPMDLALLGMGTDGHTASWFPKDRDLQSALQHDDLCHALHAQPNATNNACNERMSLGLRALLRCRLLNLVITGEDKLNTYRQALKNDEIEAMPVTALLKQQQVPLVVYWSP